MREILIVAAQELAVNVRRPAFIVMTLLVPAIGAVALAVAALYGGEVGTFFESQFAPGQQRFGYVDQAGVLAANLPEYADRYAAYPDEAAARADLVAKRVGGYFVLAEDYMATGNVTVYGSGGAFATLMAADDRGITRFLVANLVAGKLDDSVRSRVVSPANVQPVTLDENGEVTEASSFNWMGDFLVPYVAALLFVMTLFSTSGFLLQGVAEEKEGRIIEILLSSISPTRLLAGKILGLGAVGLIQVGVWLAAGAALASASAAIFGLAGQVHIGGGVVLLGLAYFALGYLLFATLMAVAGSMGTTQRESQQIAGIFSFAAAIPWMVIGAMFNNPESSLAVALSYIPLTAPTMMLLRLGFGSVPAEQVAISLVLLVAGIAVSLWAGAKVFRVGLLMYGKRPSLRDLMLAFRAA